MAASRFRHGRYSKNLPTQLAASYAAGVSDPQLLELRDEIALVDARATELCEALQNRTGDPPTPDPTPLQVMAFEELQRRERAHNAQLWVQIAGLIELRRRLCEAERKRLADLRQFLTADQLLTLLGAISAVIRENVTDRATLRRIVDGIQALVDHSTPGHPVSVEASRVA